MCHARAILYKGKITEYNSLPQSILVVVVNRRHRASGLLTLTFPISFLFVINGHKGAIRQKRQNSLFVLTKKVQSIVKECHNRVDTGYMIISTKRPFHTSDFVDRKKTPCHYKNRSSKESFWYNEATERTVKHSTRFNENSVKTF